MRTGLLLTHSAHPAADRASELALMALNARQTKPEGLSATDADAWLLSSGVSRGYPDALASFYQLYFERSVAMVRSATKRDEAFCLDVVQDAMIRIAKRAMPIDSRSGLDAWVARVVHTCALDRMRRDKRRLERERSSGARSSSHTPGAELAEEIEQLRRLMEGLDPADRMLLQQRFVAGRTLEQTAAASGLSGDAAHGRIRRALRWLRDAAAEVWDG